MGENTNSDILDLGGRGGKSSTVTTRHVSASQNWIENKTPSSYCGILMQRISEMCDVELLTEKEKIFVSFLRSSVYSLLLNSIICRQTEH